MGRLSPIARRCEQAVVTAYAELRGHGSDDMAAFVACTTLYRIHHPEASMNEARRLVSAPHRLATPTARLSCSAPSSASLGLTA